MKAGLPPRVSAPVIAPIVAPRQASPGTSTSNNRSSAIRLKSISSVPSAITPSATSLVITLPKPTQQVDRSADRSSSVLSSDLSSLEELEDLTSFVNVSGGAAKGKDKGVGGSGGKKKSAPKIRRFGGGSDDEYVEDKDENGHGVMDDEEEDEEETVAKGKGKGKGKAVWVGDGDAQSMEDFIDDEDEEDPFIKRSKVCPSLLAHSTRTSLTLIL